MITQFSSHLRRLDYLPAGLALALGGGGGVLLGAVLLHWAPPVVGVVSFVALLAGAVALASSGAPITVLAGPHEAEPAAPGPEMVRVPAGTFCMGSPEDEAGRYEHEGPVHEVHISAFEIMRVPVTRRLYTEVMGSNRPEAEADERPVTEVSWFEAVQFCNRLSERQGLIPCYHINDGRNVTWNVAADGYRLPTEAEWEYACRAGTQSRFSFGDDEGELGRYAWYSGNAQREAHPVGQKEPNPWDLYDMHGNVYEWCWDWLGPYPDDPQTDPSGPAEGEYRVLRGGSAWNFDPRNLRSASRSRDEPGDRDFSIGFRCVRRPRRQP